MTRMKGGKKKEGEDGEKEKGRRVEEQGREEVDDEKKKLKGKGDRGREEEEGWTEEVKEDEQAGLLEKTNS